MDLFQFLAPKILPDETIYSYLTRYHGTAIHGVAQLTIEAVFGKSYIDPGCAFLSDLDHLAEIIGKDVELLISQHTLLPYYRTFGAPEWYEGLLARLKVGEGRWVARILASRMQVPYRPRVFYCCPDCILDDQLAFGQPIWHLSHQIPGVLRCKIHGGRLVGEQIPTGRLLWPNLVNYSKYLTCPSLYRVTSQICESIFYWSGDPFETHRVTRVFRQTLVERGYFRTRHRINQERLGKDMIHYWGPVLHCEPYSVLLNGFKNGSLPGRWFSTNPFRAHPAVFSLLVGFLFEGWSNFVEAYGKDIGSDATSRTDRLSVVWQPEYAKRRASVDRSILISLMYGHSVTDIQRILSVPSAKIEYIMRAETWLREVRSVSKRYRKMRHALLLNQKRSKGGSNFDSTRNDPTQPQQARV